MNDLAKRNILICLGPRIDSYIENINNLLGDNKSELGNSKGAKSYIKHIEAILNFIDGVN